MVPVVLWLIFDYWDFWGRFAALVLLVLAASTDGIDGAIARKRNLVSDFGKLIDPIADKALLTGGTCCIIYSGCSSLDSHFAHSGKRADCYRLPAGGCEAAA